MANNYALEILPFLFDIHFWNTSIERRCFKIGNKVYVYHTDHNAI